MDLLSRPKPLITHIIFFEKKYKSIGINKYLFYQKYKHLAELFQNENMKIIWMIVFLILTFNIASSFVYWLYFLLGIRINRVTKGFFINWGEKIVNYFSMNWRYLEV